MNDISKLSDQKLGKLARAAREKAKGGDAEATVIAEALTDEERRRRSLATTIAAALEVPTQRRNPWWMFR